MQDNLEVIAGYLYSELKTLMFKLDPLTTHDAQKAIRADEQKLFAFNNIAESANNRPHACGKVEDKSQLRLEF